MNILICSQHHETQVQEVCQQLKKLGANPVLFERYRKDHFIAYQYNGSVKGILRLKNIEYPLDSKTFPAVWFRPKPILISEMPGEIAKIEEKFCALEWRAVLQSLDMLLTRSKWINPLLASQKAANKVYHLKIAQEVGLNIPQTIISNDATKAIKLFKYNRVIYKTLSSFCTAKAAIYTNEIKYDQILKNKRAISMAPGIFQKYIEKQYELRVTVIGEKIFVARIDSQLRLQSTIDWRREPDASLYKFGELSIVTKNKLLTLHKSLGLIYAAYDFIVDDEGVEVFIECNPAGQWLWTHNPLGIEISRLVAEELMEKI